MAAAAGGFDSDSAHSHCHSPPPFPANSPAKARAAGMKTLTSTRFILACAMTLVAGYALYASLHWPYRTALFPRVIGIPLLALALWETFLVLFGTEKRQ